MAPPSHGPGHGSLRPATGESYTRGMGLPSSASGSGLADRLRQGTRPLHVRAERSGILAELLRGRASQDAYALLLRNLLGVYEEMESGLERGREHPAIRPLACPAVYRTAALRSDLDALGGPEWAQSLPRLPSGSRYAQRVSDACRGDGTRLLAHAYVRYLGDLNGGRIVAHMLRDKLGLGPESLAFYAYPQIAEPDAFLRDYRSAVDAASSWVDADVLLDEARAVFQLNIDLSEEVLERCA